MLLALGPEAVEASCLFPLEGPARTPSWIGGMSGPEGTLQTFALGTGEGTHSRFVAEPGGGPGLWISIPGPFPPSVSPTCHEVKPKLSSRHLSLCSFSFSLTQPPSPCSLLVPPAPARPVTSELFAALPSLHPKPSGPSLLQVATMSAVARSLNTWPYFSTDFLLA